MKKYTEEKKTLAEKWQLHSALRECVCVCVLIWRGLGNWMVQNGMLHCADPMVHSKALDE